MDTNKTIEERLWDYIDGRTNSDDRAVIAGLIASDIEWGRTYRELLEAHQLLTSADLDAPSLRFTRNVMEEITRHHVAPATQTYINKNIIRGIGAFFGVMIGGFFVYFLSQLKWNIGFSASSHQTPITDRIGLNKVDWSKAFGSLPVTLFLLVFVVLGLIFLDMYLQRRKNQAA